MRRRDVFLALAGAAGFRGVATAQPASAATLSATSVAELMRASGLEPQPGEAARVLGFLLSVRPENTSDPRVEPALRLEPDIEPRR